MRHDFGGVTDWYQIGVLHDFGGVATRFWGCYELDEELRVERERQDEASKVAIAEMFDEVQARIDVDYELAARMTQEEQEMYTIEEKARRQKRIQDFTPIDSEKEAHKPEEEAAEYEKEKGELRSSLKIIPNDDSEV
ncbi:hypothetical protein Tco_1088984, partial [Tanacetum coccineum]